MALSKVTINNTEYTELAEGACFVDSREGNFKVHFGATAPAVDTDVFIVINDDDPLNYNGTSKVFALSYKSAQDLYVEV